MSSKQRLEDRLWEIANKLVCTSALDYICLELTKSGKPCIYIHNGKWEGRINIILLCNGKEWVKKEDD